MSVMPETTVSHIASSGVPRHAFTLDDHRDLTDVDRDLVIEWSIIDIDVTTFCRLERLEVRVIRRGAQRVENTSPHQIRVNRPTTGHLT